LKLGGGLLLFLCIVGFGFLPIRWHNFRTNKTLLSISNCFSGGLFFAIGLIHILPEAGDLLERNKKHGLGEEENEPFPWSYLICLSCFSFVLMIDKVFFNANDEADNVTFDLRKSILNPNMVNTDPEENFKELVSSKYKLALRISHLNLADKSQIANVDGEERRFKSEGHAHSHGHDHGHEEEGHGHDHEAPAEKRTTDASDQGGKLHDPLIKKDESPERLHGFFKKDTRELKEEKKTKPAHDHGHGHGHEGHQHATVKKGDSALTAYILLLAMGIHGIFAGLAFGVTKSEKEIFGMFLAMIAHKWSEALTVGISFVTAEIPDGRAMCLIIFLASLTPTGIFLGWLLSATNDTVTGVCMALSSGTFLYISCAEIIVEEFAISKHKFYKLLAYIVGILFVISLSFLE